MAILATLESWGSESNGAPYLQIKDPFEHSAADWELFGTGPP